MTLMVREARWEDLSGIVNVHIEAFPGFFLTLMGTAFLGELYKGFLRDESSICMVLVDGQTILGFAFGTTCPEEFFRSLRRTRWYYFGIYALPALIRHPLLVVRRLWAALSYRGEKPHHLPQGALLSSIGVAPSSAGQGSGKLLVEKFCETAALKGAECVFLTTDGENNDAANSFYGKAGFRLEDSLLKYGSRQMNRYVRTINRSASGSPAIPNMPDERAP